MEYRNVGAHVEDLDSGVTVGVGETVELDSDQVKQPMANRLIEEGVFVSTTEEKGKSASSKKEGGNK